VAVATARAEDRAHLARAIALAERARGRTSPNPPVGCVLVREGVIVGEGATAAAGGPHAEAAALAAAADQARGATAYVTLEPCAHHGRTPPCADELAAAGVVRVVYAHRDPNLLATGGGDTLRERGVEVVPPDGVGECLRGAVAAQLEGFLTVIERARPHVTLKLAQTATAL
jgi:diaminohydroxyphosphoribosylaminopyrimidine deaminase / 5-amino-6-(5-phosphoribosylamino)uracil reductase